eukprot:gb/GECG01007910.1/.p1 GENE.gb/GECG01007910.1/~~gb/GECG01007910.1/.p1  ORF type:complete len:243 (+),score=64.02 gb/GECG01007910.1/:1-729(+)
MQIGRQSSQANTFDLFFTDKEGKKTEFRMIEDEYAGAVKDYIHQNYEAPEEDNDSDTEETSAEEEIGEEGQKNVKDTGDSEDEDDFDENDDGSDSNSSSGDSDGDDDEDDDSDASADSADLDISNAAKKSMAGQDDSLNSGRRLRHRVVQSGHSTGAATPTKDANPEKQHQGLHTSSTEPMETEEGNDDTESEESSTPGGQKQPTPASGEKAKRPHSSTPISGDGPYKAQKVQSSVSAWFVE